MISSGVRIGTPALAARGFGDDEFRIVADVIARALQPDTDEAARAELGATVRELADRFPLYPGYGE